ncbi:hypothetical protein [Ancylobacter amanitiformis]|uniref:Uncharacterized protein n=1 Tax=Ancylobacter amanitiformis TaxID=217069 RepID=A0ABU0LTZ4_9HYPH|nr:hypothetical protein [Ancylobacter amanitiformis]MDQ0512161.1 hypothetical protein [Ancylobacter amanitiformis]
MATDMATDMTQADETTYRFVPEARRLDDLFTRYEEERRRAGLATALERVSPAQRIDAVTAIFGLNGARGWHRQPGEDSADLWLRYLSPVLAETRQSAAALEIAAREDLPGVFEPPIEPAGRPPPLPDLLVEDPWWREEHEEPPPPSTRELLVERLKNALRRPAIRGALAVGLATLLVGLYLALTPSGDPATDGTGTPIRVATARPSPMVTPDRANAATNDPFGDEYRRALGVALTAQQQAEALTPRQLAAIYAGESDSIGEPAMFLSAMRRRWPLPPDAAIPLDPGGALALQHFAWAFVATEQGAATPLNRPALDRATPDDTFLARWLEGVAAGRSPARSGAAGLMDSTTPTTAWPGWLAGLAFLPALAALAWSAASFLPALIAALTNPQARRVGVEANLPAGALALTAPPPARRLARQISWQEPGIARRIHADRSVRATVRAGGFPTIVPRRAPRSAHYVFLVPRLHPADHERDRVSRFIEAIARGGVSLDVYDYDRDPRTLIPRTVNGDPRGGVLDLRALRERHAEARLVLVTDGAELVDYFTQRPHAFIAEELALWPRRMLLTPLPLSEWGEREFRLAQALDAIVGRATPEGFHDLALGFGERAARPPQTRAGGDRGEDDLLTRLVDWLEASDQLLAGDAIPARPSVLRYDDPVLTSDAEPPAGEQAALIDDLRRWLGPYGFHWLAATAAYPQLRFAITLYLGLRITIGLGPLAVPLYDERRLAQLSLLPWFRNGHMPHWLRRALFAALTPASRQRIRDAVDTMLNGAPLPTGAPVPAGSHLPIWRPEAGGLDIPHDAVMADLWLAERSDIVPMLRGGAFSRIFRDHLREVATRRLAVIGLTLAWCLGAFWLWPAALSAPHPPGAWFPLLAYGTATGLCGGLLAIIRHHRAAPEETNRAEGTEPVPDTASATTVAPEEREGGTTPGDAPAPPSPFEILSSEEPASSSSRSDETETERRK